MSTGLKFFLAIILVIIAGLPLLAIFAKNKGVKNMENMTEQERLDKALHDENKAIYHKISPKEGKDLLDNDKNIILVDVRTPEEFGQGHIAGSILIPDYDIHLLASERLPNKDTKIIVYCRSGARSFTAAKKLVTMNYSNVFDMGGIMSWPYGVVK